MSTTNNSVPNYTNKNIILHELIGLKVKIKDSTDKKRVGIVGSVINETKNTFALETEGRIITIPKKGSVFIFYASNKSFIVDGGEILFRPYERIKKGIKYTKKRD